MQHINRNSLNIASQIIDYAQAQDFENFGYAKSNLHGTRFLNYVNNNGLFAQRHAEKIEKSQTFWQLLSRDFKKYCTENSKELRLKYHININPHRIENMLRAIRETLTSDEIIEYDTAAVQNNNYGHFIDLLYLSGKL